NVGRQGGIGLFVLQGVRDVGEERALRLQTFHQFQRLLDGGMRRMRTMPQCIEKKNVETLNLGERAPRDLVEAGEVWGRSKTEAVDLRLSMQDLDDLEAQAEQLQVAVEDVHAHPGQSTEFVCGFEDVLKHLFYDRGRFFPGIQRQLFFMTKTQR